MYKRNNKRETTSGVIEVKSSTNGDSEYLVKKFTRKVRNSGILDEYRSRQYFKSKSEVRREKAEAKERIIRRVNERRTDLLKPVRSLPNRKKEAPRRR